jgi:Pyruvate/2-oxoacid:ferredoxin oxidoreductase gamma subunit
LGLPPEDSPIGLFFAISGVLPREKAIGHIKDAIRKTYERKGQSVVDKNFAAVDGTLARLSIAIHRPFE